MNKKERNRISDQIIDNLTQHEVKVFRVKHIFKNPCNGEKQNEATLNEKQIREWWELRIEYCNGEPEWGAGIPLGISNDICVVECVGLKGAATKDRLLSDSRTGTYSAGDMPCMLFRMPKVDFEEIDSDIEIEGLRFKLGHGDTFARVPPTEINSFNRNFWESDCSPADVGIAEFPDCLVGLIKDHLQSKKELEEANEFSMAYEELDSSHSAADEDWLGQIAKSDLDCKFLSLSDVAEAVRSEIENGTTAKPIFCGEGEFEKFCLLPGTITLIGASAGVGKTALVTQLVFDALLHNNDLSALIANVEVAPAMLWKRQLCRYASVDSEKVVRGQISGEMKDQLFKAEEKLKSVKVKVTFDNRPQNVDFIESYCSEFRPDIVVLDYAQRFLSGVNSGRVNETAAVMHVAREIAKLGIAVIVVSATNRGSGDQPTMDCFRDSSELEFGADDAYHMMPDKRNKGGIKLTHLKARSRAKQNIELEFYGQFQRFESPVFDDEVSDEGVAA